MDAENMRANGRPEGENLMPGPDMSSVAGPRRAPTLVPVEGRMDAEAEQTEAVETARRAMMETQLLMRQIRSDLVTAAAVFETLIGSVVPAAAVDALPPEPFKASGNYFEAERYQLGLMKRDAARLARTAAILNRVFDLDVKESA